MRKKLKGLSWDNAEKIVRIATQLAGLAELLHKGF